MLIFFFIIAAIINILKGAFVCADAPAFCDPRCKCCKPGTLGTSDDCLQCVPIGSPQSFGINYYMAVLSNGSSSGTCDTRCPTGQYIVSDTTEKCGICDVNCTTCTGPSNLNCTSCNSISFSLNITQCYNRPTSSNQFQSNIYNPCPDPYYGWPLTMVCLPCTAGCASCSIALQYLMPSSYQSLRTMSSHACLDSTCSQTLKCYSCKPNYTLVQFFCLPNNQCRQYAVYTSNTIQFNPDNCFCLPYYYMISSMSCSRCDITCLTCSQNGNNNCLSCPDGGSLQSGGSCSYNSTYTTIQNWSGKQSGQLTGANGTFSATPSPSIADPFTTGCSKRYLFGCDSVGNCYSGSLAYSSTSNLPNHYGIRVIFAAVFIDAWPSSGTLYIQSKVDGQWIDSFSYNYNSHGVVGQFLCFKNVLDVVQIIDGWWPHVTNSLDFIIKSNTDLISTKYYWGMRQLIIMSMKCDSSCNACVGPTSSDCTQCPANQTVFNFSCIYGDILFCPTPSPVGKCVCDINNGYYFDSVLSQCVTQIPDKKFKNNNTRSYVGSCPTQLPFTNMVTYFCVQTCDKGTTPTYKFYSNKSCIQTCNADASIIGNYYKFDGEDPQCVTLCPSGTVADSVIFKCTSQCQSGYFSYSQFYVTAYGNFCSATCPTNPKMYAYNGTGSDPGVCLYNCPNGYFRNNNSGFGICQLICSVTYNGINHFGNNASGSCVDTCPVGSYADNTTHLCLAFCDLSKGYFNQMVGSIGKCVQTCDSLTNLFGNPLTGFCVKSINCSSMYYGDVNDDNRLCTTLCKVANNGDLYYGDNTTKLCQTTCNSGYKYNSSKICVAICPTPLFGDKFSQYCVSICPQDNQNKNQYGDVQQNMQCVTMCSNGNVKGTTPTFGENITFTCVINCTSVDPSSWGDTMQKQLCVTSCTFTQQYKSYGYDNLGLCVTVCPFSWFGASPTATTTISKCTQDCAAYGYFGDNTTNTCVQKCPPGYYGNLAVNSGLCSKYCPNGLFADPTTNQCVSSCPTTISPPQHWYADIATRKCVGSYKDCTIGYYGDDTSNICALANTSDCHEFADNNTQSCVLAGYCTNLSNWVSFSDPSTGYCVFICPNYTASAQNGLFGDPTTGKCLADCSISSLIADPQNLRRCVGVKQCSRSPLALYGDNFSKNMCVTAINCPSDYFADNTTNTCVPQCQNQTLIYGDPISKFCVSKCPDLSWGILLNVNSVTNGLCNLTCNLGFADNSTNLCVSVCASNTYGVYYNSSGYLYGVCQTTCITINTADNIYYTRDGDNLCVTNCSYNNTQLYGNPLTGKCISDPLNCPLIYYASDLKSLCVKSIDCQTDFFADNFSKKCVQKCPQISQKVTLNYGDPTSRYCVSLCPRERFGQNETLVCSLSCPSGTYADFQLRICVSVCSNYPIPTFGDSLTNKCVKAKECSGGYYAQNIVTLQTCVQYCPGPSALNNIPQQYADNATNKCLTVCSNGYYGSIASGHGLCVTDCQFLAGTQTRTFANNATQTCDLTCPNGTYADNITNSCVKVCPQGSFAQDSTSNTDNLCVINCMPGTFAQFVTRTCIKIASDCPIVNGRKQYSDTTNNSCVTTCSASLWGQNTTWTCDSVCKSGFKWNLTRVCIDICPADPDGTGSFSDQGMCHPNCISADNYKDIQQNRSCTSKCSIKPIQQYADNTTWSCVLKCPSQPKIYYANNASNGAVCSTNCPSYYNSGTQSCVSSCPSSTFLYNSAICLAQCPTNTEIIYFGNSFSSPPSCVNGTNCSPYYADTTTGFCVISCPNNTYLYTQNPTTKWCVYQCPANYYFSSTGKCQTPSECNGLKQFADNVSLSCVSICNGSLGFGDPKSYYCVSECPSNYYANPITNLCTPNCTSNSTSVTLIINGSKCVSNCSFNTFYDIVSNKCAEKCTSGYYADPSTNICVVTCPNSPPLYGQTTGICVGACANNTFMNNNTRKCTTNCSASNLYFDKISYYCVSVCDFPYYSDPNSKSCVSKCTSNYFSLETSSNRTCVATCPSPYYANNVSMRCVLQCLTQGYYKQNSTSSCVQNCAANSYADPSTFACVNVCPLSPLLIGQNTTWTCVTICPSTSVNLYALLTTRVCVNKCPKGMYAQNFTRTCTSLCTNGTNTYADNLLEFPACVYNCSSSQFGDSVSLTCLSVCPSFPKTYGLDNGSVRICVSVCPPPFVIDNFTSQCVQFCNSTTTYPFLDPSLQSCVAECSSVFNLFGQLSPDKQKGTCVASCSNGFASNLTRTCVDQCPVNYYGQITNKTCVLQCSLANNDFADTDRRLCVSFCPNNPIKLYADPVSRQCVDKCPSNVNSTNVNYYAYYDTIKSYGICTTQCPLGYYVDFKSNSCVSICPYNYYADNFTQTCVDKCVLYTLTYSNSSVCLPSCPSPFYADDIQRSCVTQSNCSIGYFSDDNTRLCTQVCTKNTFGYPVTNICLTQCPQPYFKDPTTFMCVQKCPNIPYLYAEAINDSRTCVQSCSNSLYAEDISQTCIQNCADNTYADLTTNKCVYTCPYKPIYYKYDLNRTCVTNCLGLSSQYPYSDNSSRSCVFKCPSGTYGDNATSFCVLKCPNQTISTYGENTTLVCVSNCITGYADDISRYCVATCPKYYYAYKSSRICVKSCKQFNMFGQDINRTCVDYKSCPQLAFSDNTTSLCVNVCPDTYYADPMLNSRSCVQSCTNINYYADPSTRTCVPKCPSIPALFGDNRICIPACPLGTYAENSTRKCLSNCSKTTPITYADANTRTCVLTCSLQTTYSSNISNYTCVQKCPSTTYADNSTRSCESVCKSNNTYADNSTNRCVTTCPKNSYAEEKSKICVSRCPVGTFADQLINRCVTKCSLDPVYYGDPNPNVTACLNICSTNTYGNPLTQQCVGINPKTNVSNCPSTPKLYFADNSTRLCVLQCPYNTYANNASQKCQYSCPPKSFADNSTMICVAVCPTIPNYYGNTSNNICVKFCSQKTYADDKKRLCVNITNCTKGYFADNSTLRCVLSCPSIPVSFADNSTYICVSKCPENPNYFADLSTLTCVYYCPNFTYAENTTRSCVKTCGKTSNNTATYANNKNNTCVIKCPNQTYADNNTLTCVSVCPMQPPTYSDNTSNTCVTTCPANYFADLFSQKCVLNCISNPQTYSDNSTRKCVLNCPMNQSTYADNVSSACVSQCPSNSSIYNGTYGDNITKTCVFQCPFIPFLYAQNSTRTCLASCLTGYAQNNSRVCVKNCPNGSYAYDITLQCVQLCPINYFGYKSNNTCLTDCPAPLFADNTTRTCVPKCPVSQLLFGYQKRLVCMYSCPQNTYADLQSQKCVQSCPDGTFAQNITNSSDPNLFYGKCVNQCSNTTSNTSYGYNGPPVSLSNNHTNICLEKCPDPYYINIQDNLCHRCPKLCASCINENFCILCINYTDGTKAYLYQKICYQTCPTVPILTYANNATLKCGTNINCSSGLFASNISKSCVSTCQNGTYQNNVSQTCDNCIKYCISCNNYSSCLECDKKYALWSNYVCYAFCSRLAQYYYGSGCVTNCPEGTYLNLTSCLACDETCLSCVSEATNCIACSNGLYLQNHICTPTCSEGTKGINKNGILICQSCSSKEVNCKTSLTFKVQQFVKEQQYIIILTWSSQINVKGSISDAIKLSSTKKRLLLENLSYSIVDLGNGVYEFIVNNINASTASGLQFKVQIVNPSAITSKNGDIPSMTVSNIIIPASVIYDLSDYNKNFYNYAYFVNVISILFIFMLFWTKGQIWMQVIDTLQMLYVLYFVNITLPPTPTYMFGSFKVSFFSFIPSIFTNSLPKPLITSDTSSSVYSLIGDFMFLRNQGYLFSILIIVVVFIIVMLILTKNKSIIKNNQKRHVIKKYWKQLIIGEYLHNLVYLFYLPTLFFVFFQMRDYKLYYPIVGFSIFSSLVFLILFLAIPIYFSVKFYKFIKKYPLTFQTLIRAYNFIIKEPIFQVQNQQNKFTYQKNNIDLKDLRHPKINQKLILPYAIETNMEILGVTQPIINYLYKTLLALFMAVSFKNPLAQLLLLIILNLIYLLIIAIKKPYFYKRGDYFIKNWLLIGNMLLFILIQLLMVIFTTTYQKISLSSRIALGDSMAFITLILITINLIYLCLRVHQQFYYKIWRPFVYSQCFKQNYPYEHHAYIQQYKRQKQQKHKKIKKRRRKELEKQAIIQKNAPTLDVKIAKESDIKSIDLRPTFQEKIKNETKGIENQFYKKERSIVSKSNTLSRIQRMKMLNMIFAENKLQQHQKEQNFEVFDVKKKRESQNSSERSSQQLIGIKKTQSGRIFQDDQYEYEYIQQVYSEDENINQILGENFKGDIIIS